MVSSIVKLTTYLVDIRHRNDLASIRRQEGACLHSGRRYSTGATGRATPGEGFGIFDIGFGS